MQVLNYLNPFAKSSSDTAQVAKKSKSKTEIFGVIAFMEIATHHWTQVENSEKGLGTRYRVEQGRLIPMHPQDYQYGPLNLQGLVRTGYNLAGYEANQNSLSAITGELKKFIQWYCRDPDEEMAQSAREFLIKYLNPGLESLKRVYPDSAMEGQIELWISKINLLEKKIIDPQDQNEKISARDQRIKNLLTKDRLIKINAIFKTAYDDIYDQEPAVFQVNLEIDKLHKEYLSLI